MNIEIKFLNCTEVRMGSPFQTCTVSVEIDGIQVFIGHDFLPSSQEFEEKNMIILAKWDSLLNKPEYKLLRIDTATATISWSEHLEGIFQSIVSNEDMVSFVVTNHLDKKSVLKFE
jgi:hypothetical protein